MEELVRHLKEIGVLRTEAIINAFRAIDRKDFVSEEYEREAYGDYPLPIGHGQTISQPYTVAFMLELLQPRKGEKILDIGSGSGWTVALLAHVVGSDGFVWGIERIPALVELGKSNLLRYKFSSVKILSAEKTIGLKKNAPFDKILVSASGKTVPRDLIDQLRGGGNMVIPVGSAIIKIKKIDAEHIEKETFEGFSFVPLIHRSR